MSAKAAGRYAQALFSLAKEDNVLDKVREELLDLDAIAGRSEDLVSFFEHPLIPIDHRQAAMEALFKDRVSDLTFRFLLLLEEKNRLGLFREVCIDFEARYREEKDILDILVSTAVELTDEQTDKLKKQLASRYQKTIQLRKAVDADLIGGIRVQIGDQILDSSISTQLENFKMALIRA